MLDTLAIRILCDSLPPYTLPGVYLYGQTTDNEESVFAVGAALLSTRRVAQILIADSEARNGYPGMSDWLRKLKEYGVPPEAVEPVSTAHCSTLNTLTESEALIHHAQKRQYTGIVVTAAPFHQLRAFMTASTVAMKRFPGLNIYSAAGAALDWGSVVFHSQGTLKGTRTELIGEELNRIDKYQRQGEIAATGSVLDYLKRRDQAAS